MLHGLTYGTIARNASQAKYPSLWKGLVGAWYPMLGRTGLSIPDLSGCRRHAAIPTPEIAGIRFGLPVINNDNDRYLSLGNVWKNGQTAGTVFTYAVSSINYSVSLFLVSSSASWGTAGSLGNGSGTVAFAAPAVLLTAPWLDRTGFHAVAGAFSPSRSVLMIDGGQTACVTGNGGGALSATGSNVTKAGYSSSATAALLLYSIDIGDANMLLLSADPLAPLRRRDDFDDVTAGSAAAAIIAASEAQE